MTKKPLIKLLALGVMVMLAACAPADLDVTPTLTPTPTASPTDVPSPTPTIEFTNTPEPNAAEVSASTDINNLDFVNLIVASFPDILGTGVIEWRPDANRDIQDVNNVDGGNAKRVYITERGGGQASITFGVFDTPDDAAELLRVHSWAAGST